MYEQRDGTEMKDLSGSGSFSSAVQTMQDHGSAGGLRFFYLCILPMSSARDSKPLYHDRLSLPLRPLDPSSPACTACAGCADCAYLLHLLHLLMSRPQRPERAKRPDVLV